MDNAEALNAVLRKLRALSKELNFEWSFCDGSLWSPTQYSSASLVGKTIHEWKGSKKKLTKGVGHNKLKRKKR